MYTSPSKTDFFNSSGQKEDYRRSKNNANDHHKSNKKNHNKTQDMLRDLVEKQDETHELVKNAIPALMSGQSRILQTNMMQQQHTAEQISSNTGFGRAQSQSYTIF